MPREKTIFEKIIDREVESKILHEDDFCIVIEDKFPKAPIHLLVIPKKHIPTLHEITAEDAELMAHLIFVARDQAEKQGCEGYRVQFNVGSKGGQVIFHLHLHVMGWK